MKATMRKASSGQAIIGLVFFLIGFAGAMGVGWYVTEDAIFVRKTQPLNFPHASHADEDCDTCHFIREDGSYSGAPGAENCAGCHEEAMTESADEAKLIEEYIQAGKEIKWHIYAYQPDNVYFSHAAHFGQDMECTTCHRDVTSEEKMPVYKENMITGYSANTMKMKTCETCHAKMGANNACHVCHK